MLEFFIFALVTSITPGPNNSMLMASGMRFGRKESLPHFLGIWLGFTFLFFIGGYLLSFVPEQVFEYLQYFGYMVITYIAYKIGTTKSGSEKKTGLEKPLTFIQACLFQWVNPKGIIMAVSGLTAFNITNVEGSIIYFSKILIIDYRFNPISFCIVYLVSCMSRLICVERISTRIGDFTWRVSDCEELVGEVNQIT